MNNPPTSEPAGSIAKLEVLRRRAELGLPLFHPHDRNDYRGIKGGFVTTKMRRDARVEKVCKIVCFSRKYLSE